MGKRLIKEVPTSSLPRERMEIYGAEALSDQELLAILLRTGQHPYSVMSVKNVWRTGLFTTDYFA